MEGAKRQQLEIQKWNVSKLKKERTCEVSVTSNIRMQSAFNSTKFIVRLFVDPLIDTWCNMSQSIQSKKRRSKCNMRSGDRTAANCAELFCRPTRCPLIRDEARFKSPGIFTCESKIQICTCREGRCPKKLDTQGQDWFCTSDFTGESDAWK